jgi:hypothetical protein
MGQRLKPPFLFEVLLNLMIDHVCAKIECLHAILISIVHSSYAGEVLTAVNYYSASRALSEVARDRTLEKVHGM